ncbi:MAG: DNA polymerase III subunit [Planctomycetota bacterium]|jgi:DNA polymerase-3 subunit delta'
MAFEDILGQEEGARRLRATLASGRLPHAYLFVGSAGTGRAAMARELAQVALCGDQPAPDDYCGRCEDCRLMASGRHPDYHETGVPQGKQLLPIETVRQLQHSAGLKPVRAARRAFVIRDVQRISEPAANCFLKTLEEPPGGCLFVLIASSLRLLPETIVSRCSTLRFPNLAPDVLQRRLEADGVEPADAEWLARRSWGSPGLAARLMESGRHRFNAVMLDKLKQMTPEDNFALSDWLNETAGQDAGSTAESREALQELLDCLASYYIDLALAASASEDAHKPRGSAAAEAAQQTAADVFVERAELVLEAIERIGGNAQRRLALDSLFTQLARPSGPKTR